MSTAHDGGVWIDEGHGIFVVTWPALANGETGDIFESPGKVSAYSDRSVDVDGVFGGTSVIIEGENTRLGSFKNLRDPGLTALVFSARDLKQIEETTRRIRPRLSGGDGTTAIRVAIFFAGRRGAAT